MLLTNLNIDLQHKGVQQYGGAYLHFLRHFHMKQVLHLMLEGNHSYLLNLLLNFQLLEFQNFRTFKLSTLIKKFQLSCNSNNLTIFLVPFSEHKLD